MEVRVLQSNPVTWQKNNSQFRVPKSPQVHVVGPGGTLRTSLSVEVTAEAQTGSTQWADEKLYCSFVSPTDVQVWLCSVTGVYHAFLIYLDAEQYGWMDGCMDGWIDGCGSFQREVICHSSNPMDCCRADSDPQLSFITAESQALAENSRLCLFEGNKMKLWTNNRTKSFKLEAVCLLV